MQTKLGKKFWISMLIFGLMGQIAWVVENMYFNVFIYKMFHASAADISVIFCFALTEFSDICLIFSKTSELSSFLVDLRINFTQFTQFCVVLLFILFIFAFIKLKLIYRSK